MTSVGRWSPNKVRKRVLDGTWVAPSEQGFDGLALIVPTSISAAGGSATIGTRGVISHTSCTSLTINGVFTSSYANYMIVMRNSGSGSGSGISARLSASGIAVTGSNYAFQYIMTSNTTQTGARFTARSEVEIGATSSSRVSGNILYVYGPYLTNATNFRSHAAYSDSSNGLHYEEVGIHAQNSSYDGIVFFPNSGSFTGTIGIYGMSGI